MGGEGGGKVERALAGTGGVCRWRWPWGAGAWAVNWGHWAVHSGQSPLSPEQVDSLMIFLKTIKKKEDSFPGHLLRRTLLISLFGNKNNKKNPKTKPKQSAKPRSSSPPFCYYSKEIICQSSRASENTR